MLRAVLPPWAQEGGIERLLERLQKPEERVKIHDWIYNRKDWENLALAGGWDSIMILSTANQQATRRSFYKRASRSCWDRSVRFRDGFAGARKRAGDYCFVHRLRRRPARCHAETILYDSLGWDSIIRKKPPSIVRYISTVSEPVCVKAKPGNPGRSHPSHHQPSCSGFQPGWQRQTRNWRGCRYRGF